MNAELVLSHVSDPFGIFYWVLINSVNLTLTLSNMKSPDIGRHRSIKFSRIGR